MDKTVLRRIAIPGAIGAFLGATVLAGLSTQAARPWASALLLVLGVYVLIRFLRQRRVNLRKGRPKKRFLAPLGLIGGFVDATGGGGWGPVTTPALMATGRMEPRRVVGTMNAAEFIVAVSASVGFIVGLGWAAINPSVILPLLLGGVIAAPIAAWIAHRLPMRIMGVAVGGMIVFTNSLTLLQAFDAPGGVLATVLIAVAVIWVAAISVTVVQHRQDRKSAKSAADFSQPASV